MKWKHRGRLAVLVVACALVASACVNEQNSLLQPVADQNLDNLYYPTATDAAEVQQIHSHLRAAIEAELGAPDDVLQAVTARHETWIASNAGPDSGGLGTMTLIRSDGSNGDPHIDFVHNGPGFTFAYETKADPSFVLAIPGNDFAVVAGNYELHLPPDINLQPIFSAPIVQSQRDDLAAYLRSPESLRDHAVTKVETLRTQAIGYVDDGIVRRLFDCRTTEDLVGVDQTECEIAELTEEAEAELRRFINDEIDRRLSIIEAEADALHPLLVHASLSDRCQTCWL